MELQRLDPTDLSSLGELHALELRRWSVDAPHDPPPTFQETVVEATRSWSPADVETWLVRESGRLRGLATLTAFTADNTHLIEVTITVDVDARRQGVGTRLFQHAHDRAQTLGRRVLIGELRMDTPGERFVLARDAEVACVDVRRRLHLDEVDEAHLVALHERAREAASDYEVLHWTGPVDDELVDGLAAAMRSINDAPVDDLDWADEEWDAMRFRWMEDYRRRMDHRWHTAAARHRGTGEIAGLTEVEVRADGSSSVAYQEATTVDPRHRGHRLGLLLKLELLQRLRHEEPAVRAIDTWNAASNPHMIAINEELGYRVLERTGEWQLRLGARTAVSAPAGSASG
jgi:GNAT superfamily N-acetyltransferase